MRGDDGLINVDIGARSVKVAQVIIRGGVPVEVRRGFGRIASDDVWEPGNDCLAVERALTTALDQAGVKGRRAVCIVPRHQVTLRFTELPVARPEETTRMAALEAEQHMPLPPAETVLGCEALAKPAHENDLAPVLIAAARRPVIEAYLSLLRGAGLQVERVTTDALCLFRLWQAEADDPSPAFVLDIGAKGMVINLVEGGLLRLSRAVPGGGEDLTKAFESDLGLNTNEAEMQKQARGLKVLDDGSAPQVKRWLDSLTAEVRRSALAVAAQSVQPTRIFLTGGGALLKGLASALQEATRMQVSVLAPKETLVPAAEGAAFSLAYAAGIPAALKADALNLQLPEARAQERVQQRKRTSTAVAVAVVIAVVTFVGGSWWQLSTRQSELKGLESEWQRAVLDTAKAQALRADQQEMSKKVTFLNSAYRTRRTALDAVLELHQRAPKGIWLTNLLMERTTGSPTNPSYRLQITGKAPNNSVVADLIAGMETTRGIDKVVMESSRWSEYEKQPVVEFTVTCRYTERPAPPGTHDQQVPQQVEENEQDGMQTEKVEQASRRVEKEVP